MVSLLISVIVQVPTVCILQRTPVSFFGPISSVFPVSIHADRCWLLRHHVPPHSWKLVVGFDSAGADEHYQYREVLTENECYNFNIQYSCEHEYYSS